jgi:hypothetical protein
MLEKLREVLDQHHVTNQVHADRERGAFFKDTTGAPGHAARWRADVVMGSPQR